MGGREGEREGKNMGGREGEREGGDEKKEGRREDWTVCLPYVMEERRACMAAVRVLLWSPSN